MTVRGTARRATLAAGVGILIAALTAPAGAIANPAAAPLPPVDGPKPQQVPAVTGKPYVPPARTEKPSPTLPAPRAEWPAAGIAETAVPDARAAAPVRAGALPIRIGRALAGTNAPERVAIQVLPGAPGQLRFTLRRTDKSIAKDAVRVSVDYNAFRDTYGGDWASRLQIHPAQRQLSNDAAAGVVTAEVPVDATARTFTVDASPSGPTGDYRATSLSPSAQWQVSTQTGGFTWDYGLRTPPVPGGLQPELAAMYSSQSSDGRTVATNNQSSWVGEGWDLSAGFIERSYKSCGADLGGNNGQTKTGDLCWETDNATLSFGDRSGRLVQQDGGWHLEKDDGTKVERLTGAVNGDDNGEHWRITTTDGTQYYYGLNRLPGWSTGKPTAQSAWTVPVFGNDSGEPCRQATYAASACQQAYRWNLDHVVDAHGNSMSNFYDVETNAYGQNLGKTKATYIRGGVLRKIDYGTRAGNAYGTAPASVIFTSAERCVPGRNCADHSITGGAWPDVPWDLECKTATCPVVVSPTFWSSRRLSQVTTQVATAGTPRQVDQWDLSHLYVKPGDGTAAGLTLDRITHRGLGPDPITLPPAKFTYTLLANRVDTPTDARPALYKPRITNILSESGGNLTVTYAAPDCTPTSLPGSADTNTKRCYPVRWTLPPEEQPRDNWFHKYVVSSISENEALTGSKNVLTAYVYEGPAAWAYDDDPLLDAKDRTWSQWRGYEEVVVVKGDSRLDPQDRRSATRLHYFRGMHGDRRSDGSTKTARIIDSTRAPLDDLEQYAGFLREEITYDGVGYGEVTAAIHDPWSRLTAVQGTYRAHQVEETRTRTRAPISTGIRRTEVSTKFDAYGNPVEVNDLGDVTTASDDRCTTTAYAQNSAKMLMSLPREEKTVGVACGTAPDLPADAVSDTRTSYDGAAFGTPPVRGDVTRTEQAKSYSDGTPDYLTTATTTYDAFGRTLDHRDALERSTKTAYTETAGLTTSTRTTNPLGHLSSTTIDPARGLPVQEKDPDGRITSLAYDALGRLTKVWKPGRTEADQQSPHLAFEYGVRQSGGPNWVKTLTLKPNGNQVASYALFDGFLRERQSQAPSPSGGRILTDVEYNSRGLVVTKRAAYADMTAPGTALFRPDAGSVPNATVIAYDGAERPISETYAKYNQPQWTTTTSHGGDRVTVLPPIGGTLTTTVTDARGRTTAKLQYRGRVVDEHPEITSYTYTKRGDLAAIKDAAGNMWRYDYDVLGRKTKTDDPDKGVTRMTYDDAGQLLSTVDARGRTVASTYDALGRRTETRLGSSTGPVVASWQYDSLSKGRPTASTRKIGANSYIRAVDGYDVAGLPTGESITIPPVETGLAGTYQTTFKYAADGSLRSTHLPQLGDLPAELIGFEYDDYGLADTMTGDLPYITDTEYDSLGDVVQVELGQSPRRLWRSTTYEEGTRRPLEVRTDREQNGSILVDSLRYTYDQIGNVLSAGEDAPGHGVDTQCFRYDHLRRVTAAWTATDNCAAAPSRSTVGGPAPYWQEFTYDLIGNRTKVVDKDPAGTADTVTDYSYPQSGDGVDRPHAVTSITNGTSGGSFTYDATGNTLTRPDGGPLSWDDEGLLASIGNTSYVHDADGNQLIRRDAASKTLFIGDAELVADSTTGTRRGTRYYEGVGTRTAAGFSWTMSDRNNTALVSLSSTGSTSAVRRTDLFGVPRDQGTGWTGGARGFVGGSANTDTGLTRLGAREYDPSLGRFISVDPIIDPQDPQQLNAYAYSNNSPVTFTDPDGLLLIEGDSGRTYSNQKAVDNVSRKRCGSSIGGAFRCPDKFRRPPTQCPPSSARDVKACSAQRGAPKPRKPRRKDRPKPRLIIVPLPENLKKQLAGDGSGSLCLTASAGLGGGGGVEGCLSVDERGVTLNAAKKMFGLLGAAAGVSLVHRESNQTADEMNAGTNRYHQSGFDIGPVQNTLSEDPDKGDWAWDSGLNLGAGFSIAEFGISKGVNSGYLFEWPGFPSYIGQVPYQCVLTCAGRSSPGPV